MSAGSWGPVAGALVRTTAPNTHETARAIAPDARVVYLDNDAVVLSYLRALTAKNS